MLLRTEQKDDRLENNVNVVLSLTDGHRDPYILL